MPDSAPFQIGDVEFKDTLEGNRYSGAFYEGNPNNTTALLRAQNPPDHYIAVTVELVAAKQFNTVQVINDPTVTDAGTELTTSINTRLDGPAPDSTLYNGAAYTAGTGTQGPKFPLRLPDAQDKRELPTFIVPHDTDLVIELLGANKEFGVDVEWSELNKSVVPKIN